MRAPTSASAESLRAEPRGMPQPEAPIGEAPSTPAGLCPAPKAAQSAETQNHIAKTEIGGSQKSAVTRRYPDEPLTKSTQVRQLESKGWYRPHKSKQVSDGASRGAMRHFHIYNSPERKAGAYTLAVNYRIGLASIDTFQTRKAPIARIPNGE